MPNYLFTLNRSHYLSLDKETINNPQKTYLVKDLLLQRITPLEISKLNLKDILQLESAWQKSQANGGFLYKVTRSKNLTALNTVAPPMAQLFNNIFSIILQPMPPQSPQQPSPVK